MPDNVGINIGISADATKAVESAQRYTREIRKNIDALRELSKAHQEFSRSAAAAMNWARGDVVSSATFDKGIRARDIDPNQQIARAVEAGMKDAIREMRMGYAGAIMSREQDRLDKMAREQTPEARMLRRNAETLANEVSKINNSMERIQAAVRQAAFQAEELAKNMTNAQVRAERTLRDWNREQRRVMADNVDAIRERFMFQQDIIRERAAGTFYQDSRRIDRENRERTSYRAEHGIIGLGMRDAMDRVNYNGGANLFAIQAQLLRNYAIMGAGVGSMHFLASNVVGLQREFKQFQAITATTDGAMQDFEKSIIDVSEATKFTALEVAQAATVMGQAGLKAGQVTEAIKPVTLLATAAGTDLANAVDIVTSAMSVFDMQMSEVADIANVFTSAINNSKLSIDKLTLGLQYSGNIAAQIGMDHRELTAIIGGMANAGIRSGSMLGTGLRQLMIDIQSPSEKFKDIISDIGLTIEDVNLETNSFVSVLKTLKEAGFGTSQALDAFEVRAAAAFSAITNNLDSIEGLQREFIGSTAAVKANETQMEALTNQWAKFQSVVASVAYTAFEPVVRALTELLNVISELLSWLRQFESALKLLGMAIVGLATGAAAGAIFRLFTGLTKLSKNLVPLLGQVRTGIMGVTAAGTAAGAAAGTGGLLAGLFGGPAGLAVAGAITGLTIGVQAFAAATRDLSDAMDAAQTKVDDFEGEVQKTEQTIQSISEQIVKLSKRAVSLNADPDQLRLRVVEAQEAFGELGLEVDTNVNKVEDLISALQNLEALKLSNLKGQLRQLQEALDETADIAQQQTNQEYRSNRARAANFAQRFNLGNQGADGLAGLRNINSTLFNRLLKADPEAVNTFTEQINKMLGEDISDIVKVYLGVEEPASSQNIFAMQGTLSQLLEDVPKRYHGFLGLMKDGLEVIRQRLVEEEKIQRQQIQVSEKEAMVAFSEFSLFYADGRYRGPADIKAELEAAKAEYNARVRELSNQELSPKEMADAMYQLEQEFQTRIQHWLNEIDYLKEVFARSSVGNPRGEMWGEELAEAAVDMFGLDELAAQFGVDASNRSNTYNENFIKRHKKLRRIQSRAINRQLEILRRRLRKARNEEEIAILKEQIEEHYNTLIESLRVLHEHERRGVEGLELAELQSQQDEQMNSLKARREEAIQQVMERTTKLLEEQSQRIIDELDADIDATREEIERLEAQVDTTTGSSLDKLVNSINSLFERLANLIDARNAEALRLEGIKRGGEVGGVSGTRAGNLTAAQRALLDTIAGPESAGRYNVIYGGSKFSDFSDHPRRYMTIQSGPNAGKKSSAAGRYQFLASTWDSMAKKLGLTDFSPESQDLAALEYARESYYLATGESLDDALMRGDEASLARVGQVLSKKWTSLPGGIEQQIGTSKFVRSYRSNLAAQGDTQAQAENREREARLQRDREEFERTMDERNRDIQRGRLSIREGQIDRQIDRIYGDTDFAFDDPQAIKQAMVEVEQLFAERLQNRLASFKKSVPEGMLEDPETQARIQEIERSEREAAANRLNSLYDKYLDAQRRVFQRPVEEAQAKVDMMQLPSNQGLYAGGQIEAAQQQVALAQQAAVRRELNFLKQEELRLEQALAAARQNGSLERELALKQQLKTVQAELNALKGEEAALTGQAPQSSPIQAGTRQFFESQGYMLDGATGQWKMTADNIAGIWSGMLNTISSGFTNAIMGIVSGTMTAEEAFRQMAMSIIQYLMEVISKMLVMQIMSAMFGGEGGGVPAAGGGGGGGGGILSGIGKFLTGLLPLRHGGLVPQRMAHGGFPARDSVPAILEPGEFVMRRSAVSMIGEENLERINGMGNRRLSNAPQAPRPEKRVEPRPINVWIAERDQLPPPGPDDVVAWVGDNLRRRGQLRTLVKSIQTGSV